MLETRFCSFVIDTIFVLSILLKQNLLMHPNCLSSLLRTKQEKRSMNLKLAADAKDKDLNGK